MKFLYTLSLFICPTFFNNPHFIYISVFSTFIFLWHLDFYVSVYQHFPSATIYNCILSLNYIFAFGFIKNRFFCYLYISTPLLLFLYLYLFYLSSCFYQHSSRPITICNSILSLKYIFALAFVSSIWVKIVLSQFFYLSIFSLIYIFAFFFLSPPHLCCYFFTDCVSCDHLLFKPSLYTCTYRKQSTKNQLAQALLHFHSCYISSQYRFTLVILSTHVEECAYIYYTLSNPPTSPLHTDFNAHNLHLKSYWSRWKLNTPARIKPQKELSQSLSANGKIFYDVNCAFYMSLESHVIAF